MNLTACVEVKKLVSESPSTEKLDELRTIFEELSNKVFEVQDKLNERLDYFEDLSQTKPELCKKKSFVNELATRARITQLQVPTMTKNLFELKGILTPPIKDYTPEIIETSNRIMENFKKQVVETVDKMGFVVKPILKQQIAYLKVQIRQNFYLSLHERFSDRSNELAEKLEDQVELFQDVYQLYTFIQSQVIDDFVALNDRFEHETLWRYPTASKLKEMTHQSQGEAAGEYRLRLLHFA